MRELRARLDTYFRIVVRNIRDSIPKIIGHFLVRAVQERMQLELFQKMSEMHEAINRNLGEPLSVIKERKGLNAQLEVLRKAERALSRDPEITNAIGAADEELLYQLKKEKAEAEGKKEQKSDSLEKLKGHIARTADQNKKQIEAERIRKEEEEKQARMAKAQVDGVPKAIPAPMQNVIPMKTEDQKEMSPSHIPAQPPHSAVGGVPMRPANPPSVMVTHPAPVQPGNVPPHVPPMAVPPRPAMPTIPMAPLQVPSNPHSPAAKGSPTIPKKAAGSPKPDAAHPLAAFPPGAKGGNMLPQQPPPGKK